MKTIGIVVRPEFTAGIGESRKILSFLESKRLEVRIPPHLAKALNRSALSCALSDMHVDFALTLGGDGTVLYAARELPVDVPLLPINLLSFGFLAEGEIEDTSALINQALAGNLQVQEVLRLTPDLPDHKLPDATNEIALFPEETGRPPSIQIQVEEYTPLKFRGDGLVIASPTGSTAHALSLGGPILSPHLDVILIVPAGPLRHSFLPLGIPGSKPFTVQITNTAQVVIDGNVLAKIPANTPLTIQKSKFPLRILRRPGSFYSRLQSKLLRCL